MTWIRHFIWCHQPTFTVLVLVCRYAVSTRWERELAEGRDEEEFLNKVFCCCARRVGNMYFLIEKQDGSPVVVAGPCWPFCMGVTVPLIVGISAAVIFLVIFNQRVGFVSTWGTSAIRSLTTDSPHNFSANMGRWHLSSHSFVYLGCSLLRQL